MKKLVSLVILLFACNEGIFPELGYRSREEFVEAYCLGHIDEITMKHTALSVVPLAFAIKVSQPKFCQEWKIIRRKELQFDCAP